MFIARGEYKTIYCVALLLRVEMYLSGLISSGTKLSVSGLPLGKKATIHQLTTILSTSKNVQFPDHNLITHANDPLL